MQLLQSLFNITLDALIYDVAKCWEKHFDWSKLIERRNDLCFTLSLIEGCRQQQPQLSVPAGLCPGLKATLPKAAHGDKAAALWEHPTGQVSKCKLTTVDDSLRRYLPSVQMSPCRCEARIFAATSSRVLVCSIGGEMCKAFYEIRMQKYDKELLQMYLKGKKLHALHSLKPFLTALTWYSFRCYGDCYPVIYTFKENISILSHEILSVRNPSLMQYKDYYLNRSIRHSFS